MTDAARDQMKNDCSEAIDEKLKAQTVSIQEMTDAVKDQMKNDSEGIEQKIEAQTVLIKDMTDAAKEQVKIDCTEVINQELEAQTVQM